VLTTVLVIDSDQDVVIRVRAALEAEGHQVHAAATGRKAQACLPTLQPSLILMEILLPDMDGLLLCGTLRELWPAPIIMLSSSPRRSDRILSLRLGADDFISKPFQPEELAARVDAVLRRAQHDGHVPLSSPQDAAVKTTGVRVGGLLLDDRRRRAMINGVALNLTVSEYRLLAAFASDPGRALTRDDLREVLGGHEKARGVHALDIHIGRLRRKLEAFGNQAPLIVTVRDFGYRLELPEEETERSAASV
jgi:DNA-binding response OmpR family regulator